MWNLGVFSSERGEIEGLAKKKFILNLGQACEFNFFQIEKKSYTFLAPRSETTLNCHTSFRFNQEKSKDKITNSCARRIFLLPNSTRPSSQAFPFSLFLSSLSLRRFLSPSRLKLRHYHSSQILPRMPSSYFHSRANASEIKVKPTLIVLYHCTMVLCSIRSWASAVDSTGHGLVFHKTQIHHPGTSFHAMFWLLLSFNQPLLFNG